MREIKFRAWDKNINKMFYGEEGFDFEPDGCILLNYIQVTNQAGKNFELMQYTGLKDENGIEVFEGDIVKVISGLIAEVVFLNYSWLLKWESTNYYPFGQRVEIIGNTYENSDLLCEIHK